MVFLHYTGYQMCYYIKAEEKNPKYLTISVIRTRRRHIGTDTDYTNEKPKQVPEINATELCFLKSSNDITVGGLDEITHDCDEF